MTNHSSYYCALRPLGLGLQMEADLPFALPAWGLISLTLWAKAGTICCLMEPPSHLQSNRGKGEISSQSLHLLRFISPSDLPFLPLRILNL